MAKRIQVGGRIESKEVGGIVTGAADILDDAKGKKQSVINGETDDELLRLDQSKQDNLTFDNAPTEGSDNPVKSGGVYAADKALSDAIEAILLLIPSAASALNKLVDTAMMNSSISTATATFKGTYNVITDLSLTVDATYEQIAAALGNVISTADNNDYAFVQVPVSTESTDIRRTERYKFNGTAWVYEYDLNTSGFTAAQWAAINSGITLALVGKLIGLPTSSELQALLGQKQDTLTFDNIPVSGSANPVKSGGVYSAINDEKTAREQLAQTVTGIDGRVENVEEVIPTGAAANNKLVANNSMEAYVTSIIEAITASFIIETSDGHINLTLTQTNGRVSSLTLTSSDIASAQALTALTGRVSTAESNITTLGGRMTTAESNITTLGGRVSTNETDIADLQELYNDLQQSKPVPVTALPSTGQLQGVIYRLAGTTSYGDYMWNGSSWVLMATYNNAIDPRPKKASQNLVTSGGVFDNMGALDVSELNATENPHTLAQYVDLSAALAAIPTDYQKGGMSIKYVQTSDNKYVQFRCMADEFTTDITKWQGVDDKPTAGSKNLVESGGAASQINGVALKTSLIQADLYKSGSISLYWQLGKGFGDSGYTVDGRRIISQKFPSGNYNITPASGYQYNIYGYNSDSSGTQIVGWYATARENLEISSDFIINIRLSNNASLTETDLAAVESGFAMTLVSSKKSLEEIRGDIVDIYKEIDEVHINAEDLSYTVNSSARLDKYWTADYIKGGAKVSVKFNSTTNDELSNFDIYAYQNRTLLSVLGTIKVGQELKLTIPSNTTRLRFFNSVYLENAATISLTTKNVFSVEYCDEQIEKLNSVVFPQHPKTTFVNNVDNEVLLEMYFPNITSEWKVTQVLADNDSFRLGLKKPNGDVLISGLGDSTYSMSGKYSDLIHTFVDPVTCEILGYYVLHYASPGYGKTSSGGLAINVDLVKSVDNSPIIKEYLNRKENLVLLGDSLFGYSYYNILAPILRSLTNKKVYNVGCHGATMALRFNGDDLDRLSYVTICESINSEDYTIPTAAASGVGAYPSRVADLKAVDWSLPTTVIVCYCNNDLTSNVPIGDLWDYTVQVTSLDKTTLLGAMNYGIAKLLGKYPSVRLIHTNQVWRYKTMNSQLVPPYLYTNTNGDSDEDYSEAIQQNAERLGVSFFDFFHNGGRNEYSRNAVMMDNCHFNLAGYEKCAKMLDAIDKGWKM